MNKLSAVIITKNEEEMIEECLKSLFFVSEIIVIDSYSEDSTPDICKRYNANVINHDFKDFSDSRNFGAGKAKSEWILYIDADEQITFKLQKEILEAVNSKSFSAYNTPRHRTNFGKDWPHKDNLTRLMLKKDLVRWRGVIHESPEINGLIGQLNGELLHFTHRNIKEMLNKTNKWSNFEAQLRLQTEHPKVSWWRLIRVFVTGFFNSYIKQGGYKVGSIGIVESVYQGFSMFITYVKLWELQNQK